VVIFLFRNEHETDTVFTEMKFVSKWSRSILTIIESESKMKNSYNEAKTRIKVSPGESLKIIRELQALSQADLAKLTQIPQSTISAIENDRINLGVERAKVFALALKVHPAVLVFPGWNVKAVTKQNRRERDALGHLA
jgi:DNA-binding XRE family transcriptional regulator